MNEQLRVTARTIGLINMAVCEQQQQPFEVTRPHNLQLIEKQYRQLERERIERRIAFVAYMVNQLSPFARYNRKTATVLAQLLIEQYGLRATVNPGIISGLLKHDVGVDAVEQRLCA